MIVTALDSRSALMQLQRLRCCSRTCCSCNAGAEPVGSSHACPQLQPVAVTEWRSRSRRSDSESPCPAVTRSRGGPRLKRQHGRRVVEERLGVGGPMSHGGESRRRVTADRVTAARPSHGGESRRPVDGSDPRNKRFIRVNRFGSDSASERRVGESGNTGGTVCHIRFQSS
jgi:hypothetical protein